MFYKEHGDNTYPNANWYYWESGNKIVTIVVNSMARYFTDVNDVADKGLKNQTAHHDNHISGRDYSARWCVVK